MGTRSLTYVYDGSTPIVCMYRQFDGYPSGHGAELAEFLSGGKVVNGLGFDKAKVFNGMGCLAAAMIAHFKDGPGGFYIHAVDLGQDAWQDYEYHVYENEVRVFEGTYSADNTPIFVGSWESFEDFCSKELA